MNPGSDFAPIIESYASSEKDNFQTHYGDA